MYVYADDAKIHPAVLNDEDAAQLRKRVRFGTGPESLLKFNLSNFYQVTLTGRSKRQTRNYTIDADKLLTGKECEKNS